MNTSFKIKKFKRINEEITLENFANVNYFVGKNASGKTSILNALSFLNNGTLPNHFSNKDSKVELEINGKRKLLEGNGSQTIPNNGTLNLKIILSEISRGEKGENGVDFLPIILYDGIEQIPFEFLNETLDYLKISQIVPERIINNQDAWDDTVGTRVFKQEEAFINLTFQAEGVKAINRIRHWLDSISNSIQTNFNSYDAIFIIMEELENNLHPELQKKIPILLDEFVKKQDNPVKEKLFIFVSTHSPFIISSCSNFDNQKVYLLNEGKLADLNQNAITSSEGFTASECAWVVSQMLGSDVTDLGYPENYCILEEYSLQIILDHCKNNGLIKNIQFVSASGVMRAVSLADSIIEIENLNTLVKCNPYYCDKYLLIMDNIKDFQSQEISKIDKIKTKLEGRFTELNKTSLEEYYKNLDYVIFENANSEISIQKGKNKGVFKAKWANLISELIKTKEDFSLLFGNELDFLLK